MIREIQVHFENCGQLQWSQSIDDVDDWLALVGHDETLLVKDQESGRRFFINMQTVTAIVVGEKKTDQEDLFRRAYATQKGNVQEDHIEEHFRDGSIRTSTATSRSCCVDDRT